MSEIVTVKAREILDSRGNPTVETEVLLASGAFGKAAVPSGKSTGKYEAIELRDNDPERFRGKGVLKAVENVNEVIAKKIVGMESTNQSDIDREMIELDGTANKSKLGANAILSVSLSVATATAREFGIPLYKYLEGANAITLPVPQFNVLNGGEHADSGLNIQEFLLLPIGVPNFREALRYGSEIYHTLSSILKKDSFSTSVGDEGGFAPRVGSGENALKYLVRAIQEADYIPGKDVFVGFDAAASAFFKNGAYTYEGKKMPSLEMIDYYERLVNEFPIISIEDGLAEEDWDGWAKLTERLGNRIQLVGDDIYVTNSEKLKRGIKESASNAILIKLNQIGTLTETMDTVRLANSANFNVVVSHRSGETADVFISHLAVGMNIGQIKSGAPCRTERVEKYNELMRIEEDLGTSAKYAGREFFKRFLQE
jgi:enolase